MLVKREPACSVSHLMKLLELAKKPNHKMAESAICALKDLMSEDSLGERKQLVLFTKNPLIVGSQDKKKHAQK